LHKRSSCRHSVGRQPGRIGQLDHDRAHVPESRGIAARRTNLDEIARHGTGGRAVLTGQHASPTDLPAMHQPVSVCHQWTIHAN